MCWNTKYAMTERLAELRAPISVELCESDVDNFNSKEWKLLAAVVKVLQPLDQATTELCADCYPTLSQVIPTAHCTQVVSHERVSEDYLGAPVLPQSEYPLEWWKSHGSQLYPVLAKVAQKYLSIPATQARSERLFATAENIVSSQRELLLPDHVEQLVFLHENLGWFLSAGVSELDDGSFGTALGDVRFEQYVTVDSTVETCGPLMDSKIVQIVRPHE
ncbi:hypothetical protein HPB49_022830 [Dermacentor silvarum]|uniref:Uncharacterized protein n=1 Tax=Dermacentor silvarum TaxID=543639 RepID=A0ACB8CN39_DERSI|nr:hypothetical protein HPB49_022830 [Dermacentor silvarum]